MIFGMPRVDRESALGRQTLMERALENLVCKAAVTRREVVCLTWADGHVEELENTADVSVAGTRFVIDGTDVHFALLRATEHGKPVMLWHTHMGSIEPSILDIEAFPTWLVETGCVHHIPTGTLTYYDDSGVRLSTSALLPDTLATQEI